MTIMPATPEDVLSQQHQDWLQHPVTREFIKILAKHKAAQVDAVSAWRPSSPLPNLQSIAAAISTLDTIKVYLTNTQDFVNQSKK